MAKGLGLTLPEPQKEYSMENDKVLFEYEARRGLEKRLKSIPEDRHRRG